MSAQPLYPAQLLTVDEYLALGETEPGYSELVEGRLVLSPSPSWDHNDAAFELKAALQRRLPDDLAVALDLDVNLELARRNEPGFVRRPDLLVARREARQRVRAERGVLRASEVVLVVEVVSPTSVRTDTVAKRSEYADAGIPHYWILDLEAPVTLLACHLAGEFGYVDGGTVTGRFRTNEPFDVELDLDALVTD